MARPARDTARRLGPPPRRLGDLKGQRPRGGGLGGFLGVAPCPRMAGLGVPTPCSPSCSEPPRCPGRAVGSVCPSGCPLCWPCTPWLISGCFDALPQHCLILHPPPAFAPLGFGAGGMSCAHWGCEGAGGWCSGPPASCGVNVGQVCLSPEASRLVLAEAEGAGGTCWWLPLVASTSMCLANQHSLRFQPPGGAHHQSRGPQPSAGLCREGESTRGLLRATGWLLLPQCHHPAPALGRDKGPGLKGGT